MNIKKINKAPKSILILCSILLFSICIFYLKEDNNKKKKNYIETTELNIDNNLKKIKFTIALKQKNKFLLEKKLLDISNPKSKNYGKYISKKYIQKLIINKNNNKKVINWLKNIGLKRNEIYNYGDNIVCKTNLKKIEKLIKIKLINLGNIYIEYKIPENLKNIIVLIEGLNINKYILKKLKKTNISKVLNRNIKDERGYISKEVIDNLYNIEGLHNIRYKSNGVCVVEFSKWSGFSQKDLLKSQFLNGLKKKEVKYIKGLDNFIDIESQLDIQMVSEIDNNIDIWYWNSKSWLYTFLVDIFNNNKIPDIISMSWGGIESEQCSLNKCNNKEIIKYIERVNIELIKLGLMGKSIVVSSGDSGAPGLNCNKKNPLNPMYPASSPWVTSVGATFLKEEKKSNIKYNSLFCKKYKCIKGKKEFIVNYNYIGWTSGSGFSDFQKTPNWQKKLVNNYLKSVVLLPKKSNKKGRAYPDLSIIGHSCAVFNNGLLMGIDGTSCSAPIFAGIISLLNKYQQIRGKPKLGFINPLLYNMYEMDNNIFNDIVEGYNWCTNNRCCPSNNNHSEYGYKATYGFDLVSGLGTPNIKKIKKWLFKNI